MPATPTAAEATLLERTWTNLREVWRDIALRARIASPSVRPDLPDEDVPHLSRRIDECLDGPGGEVSARARAAGLGRLYLGLTPLGRQRFLHLLGAGYGLSRERLDHAIAAHAAAGDDPAACVRAEDELHQALMSRRARLLQQLTTLPDGFKFLVDLRADLLGQLRDDPALLGLEADLRRLLTSLFDLGLLTLERITWRSPAALLEKLVAYEAVHEVQSWVDLKNRLSEDRRCFAFFHPRMPDEPLIFIQVALVTGLAGSIQPLLDAGAPDSDPSEADTAIFYSITNAQKGLRGVSLGNFLIKRVVDVLSHELPNLKTYSTLSPIPGFRTWLEHKLAEGEPNLLLPAEHEQLRAASGRRGAKGSLKSLLATPEWYRDRKLAGALEKPLTRLCARYLLVEKHKGEHIDPVARFHLSNGAQIERINWLGDISPNGIARSAGLMVNYMYRLRDIERNHEAFTGQGKVIASTTVRGLLAG